MNNDTSAYLTGSSMTWSIISLVLGLLLFIFGGIILHKNISCIKFTRSISGLWFIGYLTYLIGMVVIVNVSPQDPTTAIWIVFGCTIGFALIAAVIACYCSILGNIVIGLASGWSLWSIFSPFIASQLINLIISIILAVIFAGLMLFFKEKAQIVASAWIGSILFVTGIVYIIINSIFLSGDYNALVNGALILYIIAIVVTFLLFAASTWCNLRRNNGHDEVAEKEESA